VSLPLFKERRYDFANLFPAHITSVAVITVLSFGLWKFLLLDSTGVEVVCLVLLSLLGMDTQPSDPEKLEAFKSDKDIEVVATRAVAFPDDDDRHHDEKHRPTGVELRREMTQEEIRLAAAGYDHLTKDKPAEDSKFGDVDITEHSLPIHEVESLLSTSFNWTDPAQSRGLTSAEAEARLLRDGPNALTPPKKKSALQKVGVYTCNLSI